jgi:two-component system sensor histidine kinase/response regulator
MESTMLVPPADLLLVDDNPANLDVLSRLLRQHRHRVRMVTSGALGLAAMRMQLPELLLLDVNMPGLDGYETCQAIQLETQLAVVPVIFISALDDPLDKVKAFQVGGRDYITKPFSPEEVLARVEHQVCLRRLQRDLERQNEALLDANLKLKEIQVIKANFTAMLVHDLRSPLTSVGLVLELMKAGSPVGAPVILQAEQSFARVAGLLDEMLELHRSEHAELPLKTHPFEPSPWLARIGALFAVRAEAAGIQFQQNVPPGLPAVQGDLGKLERVLHNLLDNALKFTPRGGAIRLEAGLEHGCGVEAGLRFLRIAVIDTGRGIPAEELPFIFDPFRQVERRDAQKGFGLGLAIIQRLVAAHRGQIRAQSQVGFGSSFTVQLPC